MITKQTDILGPITQKSGIQKSGAQQSKVSVTDDVRSDQAVRDQRMKEKANEFEAVFIGQFLKHAGLEKAFGQEAGHYGQFLIDELSERIASKGGFGVADQVYEQLKRQDAAMRSNISDLGVKKDQ